MPGSTLKIVMADDDEPICNLLSDILSTFEGVAVVSSTRWVQSSSSWTPKNF